MVSKIKSPIPGDVGNATSMEARGSPCQPQMKQPGWSTQGGKSISAVACVHEGVTVWFSGVRDALMLHQCVFFLAKSEVIRFRTLQCFMLNGVIFLGSILLFNFAIDPALGFLQKLVQDDLAWGAGFISVFFFRALQDAMDLPNLLYLLRAKHGDVPGGCGQCLGSSPAQATQSNSATGAIDKRDVSGIAVFCIHS